MDFSNYLMQTLQGEIVGQEYAVAALTRAITLAAAGLNPHNRPLAVLMFAGPTGSGKTHVAQSLAHVLLGDKRKAVYVNCQQLAQATDPLANFHGQLALGYFRSQATAPLFRAACSVIVFEEIDKAPAAFRDNLVAAIDRGEVFAPGQFFPLHDSFIILTSNLSRKTTSQLVGRTIGFFRDGETDIEMPRQHVVAIEEMDKMLGAALVSRIDEIIIFEQLSEQNVITLLERQLSEMERFLACYSIGFIIGQEARTFLLKHGLEELTHGMRQLKRAMRNYLEFPVADLMLSGRLTPGTTVVVEYEAPRSFLNFRILIPRLAPAHLPWQSRSRSEEELDAD